MKTFSSRVKAAFGRSRWSPGRSGPRSAAGGRPGGGTRQRPDDREQKSSATGPVQADQIVVVRTGPAFSATDPVQRASATGQGHVPAGSRYA